MVLATAIASSVRCLRAAIGVPSTVNAILRPDGAGESGRKLRPDDHHDERRAA
jgi:hypothetical protein